MKKVTIANMISSSNIPAKLIRAVVKQSGGWESFCEMAQDINNHGIDEGFHGWIYYTDTRDFWKRNRNEILSYAAEQALEFGIGIFEMIQGFGVFKNDHISVEELARALYLGKGESITTIQNVMAWYAAEEVVRLCCDLQEVS